MIWSIRTIRTNFELHEENGNRSSGWGQGNRSGIGFVNHKYRYLQSPTDIHTVLERRPTPARGLLFRCLLANIISHLGSSPAHRLS